MSPRISRHFKADPNSHTTQASVWQAYLAAFDPLVREGKGAQLATAIEVINNVSLAFAGSESMTTTDQPPIYIIKGIKVRESGQSRSLALFSICRNAS